MRVAFVSTASNLATGATLADQIYVRNLTTNTTTLVSRADGASGAIGTGFSDQPAISGDGTRVAYDTTSLNIDAADTNSRSDVYVRVLATNDTILASRLTGAGGAVGDGYSTDAVINTDGTQVAFESDSTNFAVADTNASRDIYRRDLTGNATALISRAPGVSGAVGNSFSYDATINGDGTRIAFQSAATNLQAADTDTDRDVYMRDTATAVTTLISRADGATGADADSTTFDPSIDAAGDTISFTSYAGNLGFAPPSEFAGRVYVREVGANTTRLVSRASGPAGAPADRASNGSSITADGTSVAFESAATNLVSDDDDDYARVFLRDLDGAQATQLASRPTGTDAFVGGVNSSTLASQTAVSADGRFVVFESQSDSLLDTPADNLEGGIYLRDAVTGVTELVSRASGAEGAAADAYSNEASISADGTRIAFGTDSILASGDATSGEDGTDVYLRDRATNTTTLISRATGAGGAAGNRRSSSPAISADGTRVAFMSNATNLDAADANLLNSIYVRDLGADTTALVSRATGADGASADAYSSGPAIDADGSRVAFMTQASNLADGDPNPTTDIHVRDLASGVTVLVSRGDGAAGDLSNGDSHGPAISADGNRVAFGSGATTLGGGNTFVNDVFLRDIAAGTTVLVSVADGAGGAPGDSSSWQPSISADGSRVAFVSTAANLVSGDTNGSFDSFLRDVGAASTTLISRADGALGAFGDRESDVVALSPSGNCAAFDSDSTNLVIGGYTSPDFRHVYLRALRGECAVAPAGGGGGGGGGADSIAPVLDRVTLSAKRFKVGKAATATAAAAKKKKTPVGTRFSWRLSEAARVTLVIERSTSGRRKGRTCVKPTKKLRKAKKCTLWLRAGTLTRQSAAATTKLTFSGRIGKKALKPGSYRAVVSAVDAAGNASAKRTLAFKVVKR
jgi:Tol biopolymer transport system component